MKKKSTLKILIVIIIVLAGLQLFTYYSSPIFTDAPKISDRNKTELVRLASTALQSKDAPISALLLYQGAVIGRGYNTVIRDTNAGEHAEINAISDALKKYSRKEFAMLNRDSLLLISTYEPCAMCRGAILEYNIKNVQFLKSKTIWHLLKEDARAYRYQLKRIHTMDDQIQDSLFSLYPGYSGGNK